MRGISRRVAVIGAGFGGLSAALALRASGHHVTVYEAGHRVGGKADRLSANGRSFDTGPSLLTMPDVLEQVFVQAGTTTSEQVTLRRLKPAFRYLFPDGTRLDLDDEPDAQAEAVKATLGPIVATDYVRILAHCRQIWDVAAPSFVYGDAPSFGTIAERPLWSARSLGRIDAARSMRSALGSLTRSPHLRALFARFATYSGSDARVAPATLLCVGWVELGLGSWGVLGGISAVARALAARFVALGGELRVGTGVAEILLEGDRVAGVRLEDGQSVRHDVVVSNADTRALYETLLPPQRYAPGASIAFAQRRLARAARESTPSMSGWNAVVMTPPAGRAAHTVLFPKAAPGEAIDDAYYDEFAAIFDRNTLRQHPTIYACDQRIAHADDAHADDAHADDAHADDAHADDPQGAGPVFLMVNAPSASACEAGPGIDFAALEVESLARLRAAGVLGDGHTVFRRTPTGLADRFPGSDGALYGAASNSRFAAFLRPGNRVAGIRGLYVASGTAHPGGGVPLALLSGLAAARAVGADHR